MPPTRRTAPLTLSHSRQLRHNPTEAEIRLWRALRMHQLQDVHFRRQHAIGRYIVDFCAPRQKLVIELDGSQHMEQEEYDAERTAFLATQGYRVLRFWNHEVMEHQEDVLRAILDAIEEEKNNPLLVPPPKSKKRILEEEDQQAPSSKDRSGQAPC